MQGFAKGGEVIKPEPVQPDSLQPVLQSVGGISKALPDHAAVLAGAKARMANYLNSVRPQDNSPKLPFDNEPKSLEKERSYQKALDLAANPIGILNHIKSGTLTPENLNHLKSMYPEIHDHISKKLTEKIIESQQSGESPPYRTRQSMSLFLGSPLDSTMTPQAIQSIQSLYAPKQPQQSGAPKKQAKGTSKLGEISKDHYTQSQATSKRATEWD